MKEAKENQFHLIKLSAPGQAAAISPDGDATRLSSHPSTTDMSSSGRFCTICRLLIKYTEICGVHYVKLVVFMQF